MNYQEFLTEIKGYADEDYKNFHKKLLKDDKINLIGIRIPQLRKIAKEYEKDFDLLLTFPDEYYETTFIKLTAVSRLPYESFVNYVDGCVALMDNWATCDCFASKCIAKHKDEFLSYIRRYALNDREFTRRFALTTLLHFYVEEKYLDVIAETIKSCDTSDYYVHMAAAWLVAEILVKFYAYGVEILNNGILDDKTHNKAIQKARESYRLSEEKKAYLKGLKR